MVLILLLAGCRLPFSNPGKEICPGLAIGVLIGEDTDPIAQEQRNGYELALEEINQQGGPGGCQLSLVYQPESLAGSPNQIQKAVRSLVEEQNAVAILGATGNPASMYAASLVNYFSIPMLIPSAEGLHILPEDNHWAFRLSASDDAYTRGAFDMVKQELGAGQKVVILFEDSTAGHDIAVSAVSAITQAEMELSGYFPYSPEGVELEKLVEQIQAAQPDVLYLYFSQPDQVRVVLQAFRDAQAQMPLMTIAHAGGFVSRAILFAEAGSADPLVENLILATPWNLDPASSQTEAFLHAFQARYGQTASAGVYTAAAYQSLLALADALGKDLAVANVVSGNVELLRSTLQQNLMAYQGETLLWGKVAFTSSGQNQPAIELVQIVDGSPVVIYPAGESVQRPVIDLGGVGQDKE
ncbi:MAG: ABC transporter substrate-binding protein [Anaerolineaceae bacterium]|nr:ABC transporter substrate-binding protein [Anaerolineaceae bacterium]